MVAPVDAAGMGEVCRTCDTRLGCDVAVGEAWAASALNHLELR
jgi:hypothetical protein